MALSNVPLFAGLPADALDAIGRVAVTRTYAKNTIVISEGDTGDALYAILSGRVKVFASDEQGKEITLGMLDAGECFGELALIDEAPRTASVITLEPTQLSLISRTAFKECLAASPDLAYTLIQELAHRVRALTDDVKSLALLDVYGRVARVLLNQSEEGEDGKRVTGRLTQQDIASMVGASREMVSRILKDLQAGGYITNKNRRIVINEKLPARW